MAEAALELEMGSAWKPRVVKVSSKRQITIPADVYKEAGFAQYAMLEWDGDQLSIKPLTVRNEAASVTILRALVDRGLEGDELVSEYESIISSISEYNEAIEESLADMAAGREEPFEELQGRMEKKYGL